MIPEQFKNKTNSRRDAISAIVKLLSPDICQECGREFTGSVSVNKINTIGKYVVLWKDEDLHKIICGRCANNPLSIHRIKFIESFETFRKVNPKLVKEWLGEKDKRCPGSRD